MFISICPDYDVSFISYLIFISSYACQIEKIKKTNRTNLIGHRKSQQVDLVEEMKLCLFLSSVSGGFFLS